MAVHSSLQRLGPSRLNRETVHARCGRRVRLIRRCTHLRTACTSTLLLLLTATYRLFARIAPSYIPRVNSQSQAKFPLWFEMKEPIICRSTQFQCAADRRAETKKKDALRSNEVASSLPEPVPQSQTMKTSPPSPVNEQSEHDPLNAPLQKVSIEYQRGRAWIQSSLTWSAERGLRVDCRRKSRDPVR